MYEGSAVIDTIVTFIGLSAASFTPINLRLKCFAQDCAEKAKKLVIAQG